MVASAALRPRSLCLCRGFPGMNRASRQALLRSKTRVDEFPFNVPRGDDGFFGARATIDPHDAADVGADSRPPAPDMYWKPTPESSVIIDILLGALRQLPAAGINIVALGHVQGGREHLEHALFGAPVFDIVKDLRTKTVIGTEWRRAPTGVFGPGPKSDAGVGLSGVLWFRLMHDNSQS